MCKLKVAGRRLCCVLAIAWAATAAPARAICLISADPGIRELQTLVDEDAARALKQVGTRLRTAQQAPQPEVRLLASLYAVQAQAYGILELDEDAKKAASKGLQYAASANDP